MWQSVRLHGICQCRNNLGLVRNVFEGTRTVLFDPGSCCRRHREATKVCSASPQYAQLWARPCFSTFKDFESSTCALYYQLNPAPWTVSSPEEARELLFEHHFVLCFVIDLFIKGSAKLPNRPPPHCDLWSKRPGMVQDWLTLCLWVRKVSEYRCMAVNTLMNNSSMPHKPAYWSLWPDRSIDPKFLRFFQHREVCCSHR